MAGFTIGGTLGGLSVNGGFVTDSNGKVKATIGVGSGLSNGYVVHASGNMKIDKDGNIAYTGKAVDGFGTPAGSPISMTFLQNSDGSHSVSLGIGLRGVVGGTVTVNYHAIDGDDWNTWEFGGESVFNEDPSSAFPNAERQGSPIILDLDGDGVETRELGVMSLGSSLPFLM